MGKIQETLNLIKSGARNNKYRIIYPDLGTEMDILVNATNMPGVEIGAVEIMLRGRKFSLAGDRLDDGKWTCTLYNTEDFKIRNYFIDLVNKIQNYNFPNENGINKDEYLTEITIQQLNHNQDVTAGVVLENAFITTVGGIDYTDESGTVSTTELSFTYSGIRLI